MLIKIARLLWHFRYCTLFHDANRFHINAMRTFVLMLTLAAPLLLVTPAGADQQDPRLDSLFGVLQTTDSEARARVTERAIWEAWTSHGETAPSDAMRRGIAAMNIRRLDDALAIFSELVELAPDYAEAWNKRATVLFLLGELDQSAADVDRTLSLEPRHFGALSGLGQIRLAQRDLEAALRAFEQAQRVNPHLVGNQQIIDTLRERVLGNEL